MAKLKETEIKQQDLLAYLNEFSDFGFELSVLKMLRGKGIDCEHGGHYEDPVSKKSREFDIRSIIRTENCTVRLAVECKNIRSNFPIVVSCVPRVSEESYHQISYASDSLKSSSSYADSVMSPRASTVAVWSSNSIYLESRPVGKNTVQVGRTNDGNITANDSELYEKWGQSLSSAHDLIERMYNDGENSKEIFFSLVIPIVVVPNGRLWTVNYDNDGNRLNDPESANRCSCFIGKEYSLRHGVAWHSYQISHLEIMTIKGLEDFVDHYLFTRTGFDELFPKQAINAAIREN